MSKIVNGTDPVATKKHRRRKKKHDNKKKPESISKKDGLDLLPTQKSKTPRSSLPLKKIKRVIEPHVICAFCGEKIDNIASAIKGSNADEFFHFDCIIKKLSQEEKLNEGEKISYIGRGSFGIIGKDEEGKLIIRKTIAVETPEVFSDMKKYVEGIKK